MTAAVSAKPWGKEIIPLTSIRGIAAFLVMLHHFRPADAYLNLPLRNFFYKGYLWVDLFFVLSGFVMALTYADPFRKGYSWPQHWDFLTKRIARIYPLYFFVIVAVSFYSLAVFGGYSDTVRPGVNLQNPIIDHVTNLLMISAWGLGSVTIGGPTWSISAEWAAYLLFPVLCSIALFRGRYAAAAAAGIAALAIAGVALSPSFGHAVRSGPLDVFAGATPLPVVRCVAGFTLGLLAYRMQHWAPAAAILRNDWLCFGTFGLVVTMMIAGFHDLLIYPLLPILVASLASVKGIALRFFSLRPLWFLGTISYSLYLTHTQFYAAWPTFHAWAAEIFQRPSLIDLASLLMTYAIALITASLTYYLIEHPGRTILRRVMTRKTLQVAPAV